MKINDKEVLGVIFDLDGTLIDSCSIWGDVDKEFFKKRGLEQPNDYSDSIGHIGLDKAAIYTINRFHLDEKPEDIINEWLSAVQLHYETISLKPGVKEFLAYLDNNHIPYCLATANNKELYMPALKNNGIYEGFSFILEANYYKTGKDSPEIYLDAAKKLGISINNILVIEDLYKALSTAAKNGFITVGVDDSNCKDKDKVKKVCDKYIYDFRELID